MADEKRRVPAPEGQHSTVATPAPSHGDEHTEDTPVIGTVLRLSDPELVAAELIERRGPDYGRKVAAWVLLLVDEVSS